MQAVHARPFIARHIPGRPAAALSGQFLLREQFQTSPGDVETEDAGRRGAVGRKPVQGPEQIALTAAHIHHVSVAQTPGTAHREAGSQFVTRRVIRPDSHAETDRGVEFFKPEKIGMRPHERTVDQRKGNSRFEHGPRRNRILQQDFGIEMPAVAHQRQ